MQIARIFRIPFYLHWSWFLMLASVSFAGGPVASLYFAGVYLLAGAKHYFRAC